MADAEETQEAIDAAYEGGCKELAIHSGFVHTVLAITAKLADVTQAHALLHDPETVAFGDVGYQGVEKREENQNLDVDW